MSPIRLRPDLANLPPYKPGKAPAASDRPQYKLSANENPFPPLPAVIDAVVAHVGGINSYPNLAAPEAVAAIAARQGVDAASVVLGAGSVELVSQIIRATSGPGDEVIFAWRSFEAYPLLISAAGATPVPVPLTAEAAHDLPAMAAAITEHTRVIFLCNPNNPTGTTVTAADVESFLAAVPEHIAVIIDEAYVHFNTATDGPDGVDLFRRYPNIIVTHTFSKAYGLAGLRIGYAIAPAPVAVALRTMALPFGVSTLAQFAAIASLEAEAELQERVEQLIAARTAFADALAQRGWTLPTSQANFLWFPFGADTLAAAEVLERHGVISRAFAGEGLRLTIGSPEAMVAALVALDEIGAR